MMTGSGLLIAAFAVDGLRLGEVWAAPTFFSRATQPIQFWLIVSLQIVFAVTILSAALFP
jgi:hypothetical protein